MGGNRLPGREQGIADTGRVLRIRVVAVLVDRGPRGGGGGELRQVLGAGDRVEAEWVGGDAGADDRRLRVDAVDGGRRKRRELRVVGGVRAPAPELGGVRLVPDLPGRDRQVLGKRVEAPVDAMRSVAMRQRREQPGPCVPGAVAVDRRRPRVARDPLRRPEQERQQLDAAVGGAGDELVGLGPVVVPVPGRLQRPEVEQRPVDADAGVLHRVEVADVEMVTADAEEARWGGAEAGRAGRDRHRQQKREGRREQRDGRASSPRYRPAPGMTGGRRQGRANLPPKARMRKREPRFLPGSGASARGRARGTSWCAPAAGCRAPGRGARPRR